MNEIPLTFLSKAAEILGDTSTGLSGSKIASICSDFAFEFGIDIPHSSVPFDAPNKRTALKENLMRFTSPQQFKVLKAMCEHDDIAGQKEAIDLKIKLITRYGGLSDDPESVNEILIEETRHWLSNHQESLKLYNEALEKYSNSIYERNLLDDLRLSLELLLKAILGNNKSLENQIAFLSGFIKENGGSKELGNMFQKLVDYYSKYNNTYVKHNDEAIEEEIEFILEITSSFMKHLIRLNN